MLEWVGTAINYLNVWRRATECERQRALMAIEIQELQESNLEHIEENRTLRALLHISTVEIDEDGRVLKASEEFAALFGYGVEDLLGHGVGKLVRNEDQGMYRQILKDLRSGMIHVPPETLDLELRHRNGGAVLVRASIAKHENGSGPKYKADVQSRELVALREKKDKTPLPNQFRGK